MVPRAPIVNVSRSGRRVTRTPVFDPSEERRARHRAPTPPPRAPAARRVAPAAAGGPQPMPREDAKSLLRRLRVQESERVRLERDAQRAQSPPPSSLLASSAAAVAAAAECAATAAERERAERLSREAPLCLAAMATEAKTAGAEMFARRAYASHAPFSGLQMTADETTFLPADQQLAYSSTHFAHPRLCFWRKDEFVDVEHGRDSLLELVQSEVTFDLAMLYGDSRTSLEFRRSAWMALGRMAPQGVRRTLRDGDGSTAKSEADLGRAMFDPNDSRCSCDAKLNASASQHGGDAINDDISRNYPTFEFRFREPMEKWVFLYTAVVINAYGRDTAVPWGYEVVHCPPCLVDTMREVMQQAAGTVPTSIAHALDENNRVARDPRVPTRLFVLGSVPDAVEACRRAALRPLGRIREAMMGRLTTMLALRNGIEKHNDGLTVRAGSFAWRLQQRNGNPDEMDDIPRMFLVMVLRAFSDLLSAGSPEAEMLEIVRRSFSADVHDPYELFSAANCLRTARRILMRDQMGFPWEMREILNQWATQNASTKFKTLCAELRHDAGIENALLHGELSTVDVARLLKSAWLFGPVGEFTHPYAVRVPGARAAV